MNIQTVRNANPGAWCSVRTMIGVVILAALWMTLAAPAGAQVDVGVCGSFESQEDAQAALEENPNLAATLDSDENGIACEGPYQSEEPVVVVCNEAIGTLVEVSGSALDQGSLDFPYHQATDAEITAGNCTVISPETPPVTPESEGEPDTIGLGIRKFNCPSAAAFETGYANCELGAGVTFEVATADGDILGTCTTEIGVVQTTEVAFCYVLDVPFDTQLVITEDVSTGPAGYVPLENPQTMTIEQPAPDAADFAPSVAFVNVPATAPDGPEEPAVVVCDEANGILVELPKWIAEGAVDFPYHQATQAEIAAGECAVTTPGTGPGTPGEKNETTTGAIALPNTGAGTIAAGDQGNHILAVAGTLMLMSGIALELQRRFAR